MLGTALLALGALIATPQDEAARTDLDALQGRWMIVRAEAGGEVSEDVKPDEAVLVFDGTTARVRGVQEEDFEAQVTLDPSATPKRIDAVITVGPDQGKTVHGIYRIEGTRVSFCWAPPQQPRPGSFATEGQPGLRLIVAERAGN